MFRDVEEATDRYTVRHEFADFKPQELMDAEKSAKQRRLHQWNALETAGELNVVQRAIEDTKKFDEVLLVDVIWLKKPKFLKIGKNRSTIDWKVLS